MNKRIIKIHVKDALVYFALFCSTIPYGTKVFVGENFYGIINSYGCIITLLCCLIITRKRKYVIKNFKGTIMFTAVRIFMLFSSIIHPNNQAAISANIKYSIIIFSFCFLCESFLEKKKINLFIKSVINLYFIYFATNIVFMLIFPSGINRVKAFTMDLQAYKYIDYHFIGFRNHFGFLMLPILSFILFDQFINKKKHVILHLIIIASSFLSSSSTTIIAVVAFYFSSLIFVYLKQTNISLLSNKVVFFVYFVLFFGIVVLNSAIELRTFIAAFFGKSATLSGRTTIWMYAIEKILYRPVLGYGNENVIFMYGYYWYAHNGILDLLIQGGIALFVIYFLILIECYKGLESVANEKLYSYFVPITIMYCILMLSESIINYSILFYPVLVLLLHSNELCILKKEITNE